MVWRHSLTRLATVALDFLARFSAPVAGEFSDFDARKTRSVKSSGRLRVAGPDVDEHFEFGKVDFHSAKSFPIDWPAANPI